MIRNVIFDWCGTLVDDLPAVWRATNEVFSKARVPNLTLDRFRAEFCLPFKSFYDRYTPHISMAQLEEWFHFHFRLEQDSVAPMPYAREFLEFCRSSGLRLFVLSSIHEEHFQVHLGRTGFGDFFERPYVQVWDKRGKIHELLSSHGLRKEETLMIGDMQHDIETAKHGGIWSCAVLTGFNSVEQLRASEPDVIVEHLGQLQRLLETRRFEIENVEGGTEERPVATVGALIFSNDGKVLMIRTRKWSNLWGIPGGKIRLGETSVQALRRELLEETGLEVKEIEFVMVQDCIFSKEFFREAHFLLLNYTCRCSGAEAVVLNDEAQEWRWVAIDQALAMPLNQPTRRLIETVREGRSK